MQRIVFSVRITVSHKNKKEALELIRYLGSTFKRPGCISRRGYQDIDNPNVLSLVEEWDTQADLENHIRSTEFLRTLALIDLSNKPPQIRFNTISHKRGMDMIMAIRQKPGLKNLKHQ